MSASAFAGPVVARVRAVERVVALLRAAECLWVGLAAFGATLAAAVASGTALASTAAWAAAGISAACAAGSWWLERRPEPTGVARDLDRHESLQGALVTAFELETRAGKEPATSSIAGLLSARVSGALRTGSFLKSASTAAAALLAAPFLAAALLGLALETDASVAPGSVAGRFTARAGGLADRAAALREAGRPSPAQVLRAALLAEEALALRVEASIARPADSRSLEARMGDLEVRIAGLETEMAATGMTAGGAEGTMSGPGSGSAASASLQPPRPGPPAPAPPAVAGGSEAGVVAGRWWPRRHDAVVERWIEARRAAGEPRNR